jgi:hypothetical protein
VVEIGRGIPYDDVSLAAGVRYLGAKKLQSFSAGALRIPVMDRDSLTGLPERLVQQYANGALADAAFFGESGNVHHTPDYTLS